ncbi:MAG: hypothetical protein F6K30_08975 [Cyanothece sp. SIO2G6]|nr:hypothetical protein [Cyanothece sp. SIO2G6]
MIHSVTGIAMVMSLLAVVSGILHWSPISRAFAQATLLPNALVMMGDAIDWTNINAYAKGMVSYDTINIDRITNDCMLFADGYTATIIRTGIPDI